MDTLQTMQTPPQVLTILPETASTVLAAQAKAQIEARYVMAERHPRDLDSVRAKLLKDCRRPGFAKEARYNKPIGKGVEGPSIRFAEAAIRAMGNISVDQMSVYEDREKRIVRVIVVDCETNTPYSSDITIDKTVERRYAKPGDEIVRQRQNSKGEVVYIIGATEDDLLNKQNALISKSIRNNGLRLIPADIVEECMELCIETQKVENAADPDAAKRKLFDAFNAIGITVESLKAWLDHDGASLTEKELIELRGIYASIREGQTTWRDVMDARFPQTTPPPPTQPMPAAKKSGTETVKNRLRANQPVVEEQQPIWPRENNEQGDK